jgi:hypothetical protein
MIASMENSLNPERLDAETLDQYLEAESLPTKGDTAKKAATLAKHYATKGEPMAVCDNCNGTAPSALPTCPFCGRGDEVDAEPTEEQKTVKTKSSNLKKHAKDEHPEMSPAITDAIEATAEVVDGGGLLPAADLDKHVAKIRALQRQGNAVIWHLGREIYEVYKSELWKRRLDASGKQVYRSFSDWCLSSELNMDLSNAMKLAEVSLEYSEAQVSEYGISKLKVLVRLPAGERPQMLAQAKELPFKKLLEEVKKMTSGKPKEGGIGKKRTDIGKRARVVATEPKITAVMLAGKSKHALLARPLGKDAAPRPAKALKDDPWCTVMTPNGVELRVNIVADARGELVMLLDVSKPSKVKEPKKPKAAKKAAAKKGQGGTRKGAGAKKGAKPAAKAKKAPKAKPAAKKTKKKLAA